MTYLQKLQKQLKDIYPDFPEDIEEITISMKPEKLTIATDRDFIEIPIEREKRVNFSPYLLEFFNAELDYDFGLYAETDLRVLLQYIDNLDNPNGKRLLAYSLLETKMEQMISRMNKSNVMKILKKNTSQNINRMRQIAKRANQLMEVTNEFPIRMTTKVTPRWLYRLNKVEFEEFLLKCRRMNNLGNYFAGAQ